MSEAAQMYDPEPSIAERLRISRLRARMEQSEMAERVGVSRVTVSSWENGHSEPRATQAARWAQAAGCPLDWLVRTSCFTSLADVPGQMTLSLGIERPQLLAV